MMEHLVTYDMLLCYSIYQLEVGKNKIYQNESASDFVVENLRANADNLWNRGRAVPAYIFRNRSCSNSSSSNNNSNRLWYRKWWNRPTNDWQKKKKKIYIVEWVSVVIATGTGSKCTNSIPCMLAMWPQSMHSHFLHQIVRQCTIPMSRSYRKYYVSSNRSVSNWLGSLLWTENKPCELNLNRWWTGYEVVVPCLRHLDCLDSCLDGISTLTFGKFSWFRRALLFSTNLIFRTTCPRKCCNERNWAINNKLSYVLRLRMSSYWYLFI